MARTRTEFSQATEDQIRALMARGGTARSISETLTAAGVKGASRATIGRRMVELRRGRPGFAAALAAAGGAPSEPPPAPDSAGALPPTEDEVRGADPATLASLLERARKAGAIAAAEGNLAGIGAMGRLELQIQVEMRKATPPAVPDPNEDVDMVRLGAEVAARLHKLVDQVLEDS